MRQPVEQAISAMRDRYFDPITLQDLAAEVFVSPFHFSRVFAKSTGVTPGRYLTAIRLFEAKRLLVTSSMTVSDIVCSVGYSSVGTFTTRFTKAMGMTPSQYRDPRVRELMLAWAPDFQRFPELGGYVGDRPDVGTGSAAASSITGTVEVPPAIAPASVLVGVFADPIPQCGPVACAVLPSTGSSRVTIPNVPIGRWRVLAVAQPADGAQPLHLHAVREPVTVSPGRVANVQLRLRPVTPTDPPVAITLATPSSLRGEGGYDGAPAFRRAAA
ncbi:helix-turn-helix domain-containing protein [Saccharopolyspora indica]|uniref:helix-turn-helix domain-containing protein n=1 Tax=Saccharopolyspora indica TaxID=1229659 RepID=UPI0022EB027C|nr:helix-turn-helix domain-containing protein [Saccharopolyspora indica]MDA3646983.1 helix-turn-helix domain-containing protein [Saccharopolyspora indica]